MYLWDLPDEVLRGCLHRLQFPRILHLAAVHPQMALVSDMALASLKTIALHDFKDFEPLAVHRLQTEDNQRFLSVASIDGSNCKLSAAALSTLLAALPGARQIKLPVGPVQTPSADVSPSPPSPSNPSSTCSVAVAIYFAPTFNYSSTSCKASSDFISSSFHPEYSTDCGAAAGEQISE